MPKRFKCDDAKRAGIAERYVMGGLSRRERARYEAHLAACKQCQKQLEAARKVVKELKSAAAEAGWSQEQIDRLDRLYSPQGLLQNINWRLIALITLILGVVIVVPFIWWVSQPQTRLSLHVAFERERRALSESEADNAVIRRALEMHERGKDREVIAYLHNNLAMVVQPESRLAAHRLIGLSYLFLSKPDSALEHLTIAATAQDTIAAQCSEYYMAQAYLLSGNKTGAIGALRRASEVPGPLQTRALELLETLRAL